MAQESYSSVLVFGASGTVGGLLALAAHERGAKVWLAMRDTTKAIKGIPNDVEKAGNFVRIQADLTDPTSVANAVAQSGAKAAFIYLILAASDHQRAALKALRDGGVENIVFLSSLGVKVEGAALRAIPPSKLMWFRNAQVEIAIEDLGFPHFTALRPASFASNYITAGLERSSTPPKATIIFEDALADNVAPEDIAGVGAVVLLTPSGTGKTTLYLSNVAAETRTTKDSWALIKQITGRADIDTTPTSPEAWVQKVVAQGMPEAFPRFYLGVLEDSRRGLVGPEYEAGAANIRKYLGREPMGFVEYLEKHKAEWQNI
ncbi:NmrA domain-containing protein [Mycena chlorophos]|uniref:NmrA domain-containing protein n=1 Tax=Mycena chlorophos TaxID=658473 RepID=A0A8H6SMI9_MYCCL|nr:NmrA domain-containing protein [Mycena chlorophos]